MSPNIVETVNVVREAAWLPWAVQYFFLIGLSYGAFLLSLPGVVLGRPAWQRISRLALLAALLCGITAPIALVADLHQPGRFWHFYVYFNPGSWMAWGSYFMPVYVTGLVLYAWLALRPLLQRHAEEGGKLAGLARVLAYGGHESRRALAAAAALAFIGATLVAVYTGAEVMAVRARPLWNTVFAPLQFFATAVGGAVGLVLLFNRYAPVGGRGVAGERLAALLAATQLAVLAVGLLWLAAAALGFSPSAARALAELAPSDGWKMTAAWAVVATVLTLWLAWKRPGSGLLIGLLALHSAWMMRWTILIGGQEVPKTGAGFHAYALPLGPDGLLGIIGTAGLWIFLYVLVTTLLPLDRLAQPARAAA